LLLLGGLAGYGWLMLEQLRKDGQREWASETDVQSRVGALGERLQGRLDRLDAQAADKEERLNTLQRQLDATSRRLLTEDPTGRTDWLLAEAEYLLRLANQRLYMEKDYNGALVILKAADAVLVETKETALFPVRKAIAQEIVQLESVGKVDRTGLFLKLEALINQIEKLDQNLFFKDSPLLEETRPETNALPATVDASEVPQPTNWRNRMSVALERLERYFVIRHRDDPVEPLLAPEQIYYLQQNLRLMLEQAELALLDRNQALYERSLDKAERWIAQYFLTNDAVTRAMINNLATLKTERIDPELPDIGNSLRLLKGLMESIYQQRVPADNVGEQQPQGQEEAGA
jgi:uroporphyrin-3 C-methyltransferase